MNKQEKHLSLLRLLSLRDFRQLWSSQAIGRLGDQFYLVALPWLVLKLTSDPLAMGLVLATASVPRAVFMLVGGALTDRFSPRQVMLSSFVLRTAIVGVLAGLTLTGNITLWMLYATAFLFGLVDAFYYPALNSSVPQLLNQEELQEGNAMIQGAGQLSLFAGPVLAGGLIAFLNGKSLPGKEGVSDFFGVGLVFILNALAFLISAFMISRVQGHASKGSARSETNDSNIWLSIRSGLAYVRRDTPMFAFFIVTAAITFLIDGPYSVGIPVLADTRLAEGAAAFGIMMSAFGGGSLAGTVIAGTLPKPSSKRFGPVLLSVSSGLGFGLALIGIISSTGLAAMVSFLMGIANGYVVIMFITWLQRRTPSELLGRMMSLLMFALVGLNPISAALAGILVKLSTTFLLVGAGSALIMVVLVSLFNPVIRDMGSDRSDVLAQDSSHTNMRANPSYSTFDYSGE